MSSDQLGMLGAWLCLHVYEKNDGETEDRSGHLFGYVGFENVEGVTVSKRHDAATQVIALAALSLSSDSDIVVRSWRIKGAHKLRMTQIHSLHK